MKGKRILNLGLLLCAIMTMAFSACNSEGLNSDSMSSSVDSSVETSSSHQHEYVATTVDPTCTEQGYTTHDCTCGDTYTDNYKQALDHDFTNYVSNGDATYESDGTKTAVCNRKGCEETHTVTDEGSKLVINSLMFKTLTVNGTDVIGQVSNKTETFAFFEEVETSGKSKYIVSMDITGTQQVITKTIELAVGDNKVYVIEFIDDEPQNVYTVIIRRKPVYTVSFYGGDGEVIVTQTVEEDGVAIVPTITPERYGYTFDGWDYDFSKPVVGEVEIASKWVEVPEYEDLQLVRNLNTALSANAEEEKTMQDALDAAYEFGYDVAKINNTKVEENDIVWDSNKNEFLYSENGAEKGANIWVIASDVSTEHSTYLYKATKTEYTTSMGLDVGNEKVTSVTYVNTGAAQNVIIRTNGGKLTVKGAANDTVNYYGTQAEMDIQSGKVTVANDSYTATVYVASGVSFNVANKNTVGSVYAPASNQVSGLDNAQVIVPTTPDAGTTLTVTTKEDLVKALTGVTALEGKKILLGEDLAWTTTTATWDVTITASATLDLNGHSITVKEGVKGSSSHAPFLVKGCDFVLEDNAGKGFVKGIATFANTNFDVFHVANNSVASMTLNSGKIILEGADGASSNAICTGVDVFANGGSSKATFVMNGGSIEVDPELSAEAIRVSDNGGAGAGASATINGGYLSGRNAIFVHVNTLSKALSNEVVVNGGVLSGKYAAIRIFIANTAVTNAYNVANITLGNATYTHSNNTYESTTYYNGAIECHNAPSYNAAGYGLWNFVNVTDKR